MIYELLPHLKEKVIILASQSLRRKQILENVGLNFRCHPSDFLENLDKNLYANKHDKYVIDNAKYKANDVLQQYIVSGNKFDLIIGCDTIVTLDSNILEKPLDQKDAFIMLSNLSGRQHSVLSGVCLLYRNSFQCEVNQVSFVEETNVTFNLITSEMISAYIETGEPLDKAGGYGIQGLGGLFVRCINGDFYNVVGFPLNQFFSHLCDVYNKV